MFVVCFFLRLDVQVVSTDRSLFLQKKKKLSTVTDHHKRGEKLSFMKFDNIHKLFEEILRRNIVKLCTL